ncbi:hypothetical protein D3C72_2068060 [compost metagenome]
MHIDHIDIRLALRNALFQNMRPFVDKGQHAAIDDLLLRDFPTRDTSFRRALHD